MDQQLCEKIKFAAIVGASLIVSIELYKFIKKQFNSRAPKKWRKVGQISELYCYPIKSCGFIKLNEMDCLNLGGSFQNKTRDRTFMVVNSNNEFVTGRKYPKLVQIMPTIDGSVMTLSAPDKKDVNLSFDELSKTKHSAAVVWDESVEVIDCGEDVAKWLSEFILGEESGLRLVYYPSFLPSRDVRQKNKIFDTTFKKDVGALHDATSFMLINKKSVDELNTRVKNPVTPLQFRPNFVIEGPDAFEEDNWKYLKIGDEVVFQNVKPCTRCIFTNVDPFNANRNENEPLQTLKSYRKFEKTGESPVMGIHLGLRIEGKVQVGDVIYVEDN